MSMFTRQRMKMVRRRIYKDAQNLITSTDCRNIDFFIVYLMNRMFNTNRHLSKFEYQLSKRESKCHSNLWRMQFLECDISPMREMNAHRSGVSRGTRSCASNLTACIQSGSIFRVKSSRSVEIIRQNSRYQEGVGIYWRSTSVCTCDTPRTTYILL